MAEKTKLKIAFYWAASCGGCETALLDTEEKILELSAVADILLMPLAFDGKYKDIEALPDGGLDITFWNGAIRSTEHDHLAHLLRARSKVMVAFGACANTGGVPGMANLSSRAAILEKVYRACEGLDNPAGTLPQMSHAAPEGELTLPDLHERVRTLAQTVKVDLFLPGCPPAVPWIRAAIDAVASGNLPPAGSVIGLSKTVCDECQREKSAERKIKRFHRPHEIIADERTCLLEQGILCNGPATRGGCEAACMRVNMPCRGCFGPPPGVADQGAKLLAAVASMIDADTHEEVERILEGIPDPAGVLYQFSLPDSILGGAAK